MFSIRARQSAFIREIMPSYFHWGLALMILSGNANMDTSKHTRYIDSLIYHKLSYFNISSTAASQWEQLKNVTKVAYTLCVLPYSKTPNGVTGDLNKHNSHSTPCGKLRFPSLKQCVDCGDTHHQAILVHEAFQLNITFVEFYMSNDCHFDSLTLLLRLADNNYNTIFTCGWLQSWSIFVNKNSIGLFHTSLAQNSTSFVSILYDVYEEGDLQKAEDHEDFITYIFNITKEINVNLTKPFVIRNNYERTVYIRSNIYHQIVTRILLSEGEPRPLVRLHEGPNTRGRHVSHEIRSGDMWGKTIGFQLVVSVLTEERSMDLSMTYESVWTSLQPNLLNVIVEETNVTLPGPDCQVMIPSLVLCYYHLVTYGVNTDHNQRGFIKVNIRDSVAVDGPNTDDCRLSGLAMVSTADPGTVSRLQDTDTMSQWPVVVVCRNTMVWRQNDKTLPFETFTSHTADVALVVYTYIPHTGHINVTVSVQHTMCQGFQVNCVGLPKPSSRNNFSPTVLLHPLNDKIHSGTDFKVSLLEKQMRRIGAECKDYVAGCIYPDRKYYAKDSAAVWCTVTTTDFNRRIGGCVVDEKHVNHNFNMYPEAECLTIQSLPSMPSKPGEVQVQQCRITLHDPQARLQDDSVAISTNFRDTGICQGYLLGTFRTGTQYLDTRDRYLQGWYDYNFWVTNNLLIRCGYFTMAIRASKVSITSVPELDMSMWHTLPRFRLPILGSDLDIADSYRLKLTSNDENNLLIAHNDYTDYEHKILVTQLARIYLEAGMQVRPRDVERRQPYKSMYYVTLEAAEQDGRPKCNQANISMKLILQTTQPVYGHAHYYISLDLSIDTNSSFQYHELLLINHRFISLQTPPRNMSCVVKLRIDPWIPIGDKILFTLSPGISYDKITNTSDILTDFETFDYIVVWDTVSPISWMEARERCETLGAHLPVITTEYTQNLMEILMLGHAFHANGSKYLRVPCRQDFGPFCIIFIGLHFETHKVGIQHSSTKL